MSSNLYKSVIILYIINFVMFLSFNNMQFTSYKTIILYIIKNLFCLGLFVFVTKINISYIRNYSLHIYTACLGLLIFVHFLGIIGLGAKRWINLGVFYLQPSEFMKLCLPIYLAKFLADSQQLNLKKIIQFIVLSAIPIAIIIIQPDLGSGLLVMTIALGLLFVGGLAKRYIIGGGILTLILCPLIWMHLYTYQKQRILTFITGGDINKEGYQIRQSRITIGSGGLFGKGFMKGSQFRYKFLPKPDTDFVFSCICEEWGFIGGLVVMIIFLYLTFISIKTSLWKNSLYERYLCFAIGIYIFFSFFFNVAMSMSLLPTVGVPLPILSRGGSSSATFLLATGLLINIRNIKET